MNSSGKFFVPMTSFGFASVFSAPATPLFDEPPQAVMPIRSATPIETANAAFAARRVCLRTISPPFGFPGPPQGSLFPGTLCPRRHPAVGPTLDEREHGRREQGDCRDEDCGRERAAEPVHV